MYEICCLDPSDPPEKPEIIDYDKDYVEISWKPPKNDGGAPIEKYIIEKKEKGSDKWEKVELKPNNASLFIQMMIMSIHILLKCRNEIHIWFIISLDMTKISFSHSYGNVNNYEGLNEKNLAAIYPCVDCRVWRSMAVRPQELWRGWPRAKSTSSESSPRTGRVSPSPALCHHQ